jgi:hypothetical protein
MIHDVDDALRALIEDDALEGDVEVSFDAPTRDWASRRSVPTVSVFLYDIREDLSRRDVAPQVVRNDQGHVLQRRPPMRRFRLSYLLTAWTQRAEDEHRLLSGLLSRFLASDTIPDRYLGGALEDSPVPVLTNLALPPTQDRSLSDIWSALGGELKPSLDLIVIAPFDPLRDFHVGPPVLEGPRIDLSAAEGKGKKGKTPAAPPLESLDDGSGGERLVAGNEDEPGRTLVLRPTLDR